MAFGYSQALAATRAAGAERLKSDRASRLDLFKITEDREARKLQQENWKKLFAFREQQAQTQKEFARFSRMSSIMGNLHAFAITGDKAQMRKRAEEIGKTYNLSPAQTDTLFTVAQKRPELIASAVRAISKNGDYSVLSQIMDPNQALKFIMAREERESGRRATSEFYKDLGKEKTDEARLPYETAGLAAYSGLAGAGDQPMVSTQEVQALPPRARQHVIGQMGARRREPEPEKLRQVFKAGDIAAAEAAQDNRFYERMANAALQGVNPKEIAETITAFKPPGKFKVTKVDDGAIIINERTGETRRVGGDGYTSAQKEQLKTHLAILKSDISGGDHEELKEAIGSNDHVAVMAFMATAGKKKVWGPRALRSYAAIMQILNSRGASVKAMTAQGIPVKDVVSEDKGKVRVAGPATVESFMAGTKAAYTLTNKTAKQLDDATRGMEEIINTVNRRSDFTGVKKRNLLRQLDAHKDKLKVARLKFTLQERKTKKAKGLEERKASRLRESGKLTTADKRKLGDIVLRSRMAIQKNMTRLNRARKKPGGAGFPRSLENLEKSIIRRNIMLKDLITSVNKQLTGPRGWEDWKTEGPKRPGRLINMFEKYLSEATK